MMHAPESVVVRDYDPDDWNFITNSWLKSFQNSNFARSIDSGTYFKFQQKRIEEVVGNCIVKVAVSAQDDKQILGYIAYEYGNLVDCIVHYIFVKKTFRGFGIARKLWEDAVTNTAKVYHTHLTSPMRTDRIRKSGSIYNPFLAPGVDL